MKKVMDYEHGFFGLWSPGGVCRVRIYAGDGQTPVVVLTELEKNRNTSVTNMVEVLAAEVSERHRFLNEAPKGGGEARDDAGGAATPFLVILHHPRTDEELRWGWEPSFCSVTFASYEARRVYSYAMNNHGKRPPYRRRLGTPTFVHISHAEVLSLVGEEL